MLSKEELEAIRKRIEDAIGKQLSKSVYPAKAHKVLTEDVPMLLENIEELEMEIGRVLMVNVQLLKYRNKR